MPCCPTYGNSYPWVQSWPRGTGRGRGRTLAKEFVGKTAEPIEGTIHVDRRRISVIV